MERITFLEERVRTLDSERLPQHAKDVTNLSAQFATGRTGKSICLFCNCTITYTLAVSRSRLESIINLESRVGLQEVQINALRQHVFKILDERPADLGDEGGDDEDVGELEEDSEI